MQSEAGYWVLGAGRLGLQLSWHLHHRLALPVSVWSRSPISPEQSAWLEGIPQRCGPLPLDDLRRARANFLTVSDVAISSLAEQLAQGLHQRAWPELPLLPIFLHCSGAVSVDALQPLAAMGFPTGGFHPLQSFSGAPSPEKFQGTFFALEGHSDAVLLGRQLALALGGFTGTLRPGKRLYYHAAAVLASNLLVALEALAVEVMQEATGSELDHTQRLRMLLPLVEGTVANLRAQGIPAALTGPVSRGDVAVVARQWQALRQLELTDSELDPTLGSVLHSELDPTLGSVLDPTLGSVRAQAGFSEPNSAQAPQQRTVSEVYRLLSLEAITLARRRGMSPEQADALQLALTMPVKTFDKPDPGVINEE